MVCLRTRSVVATLILLGHKRKLLNRDSWCCNLGRDGCYSGPNPDTGRDLWPGLESGREEVHHRGDVSWRLRLFCPHRLGRNRDGEFRVLCYQYGGESKSGLQPEGSPANWRCIELERLSRVRLLESTWHTAANHSRPGSCVPDADIDAEDQRERDPQKGH